MNDIDQQGKIKLVTILFILIVSVAAIFAMVTQGIIPINMGSQLTLKEQKKLLDLKLEENDQVILNEKQIVKISTDGITAYDLNSDQIWADTISLKKIKIRQREPYFAVGSQEGNVIYVYNAKGKKAEIKTDYPIMDFSINKNGEAALIEKTDESYIISAYDQTGKYIGKRESYVDTDGYPTTVEISPDNQYLLASYINGEQPTLTSTLVAIDWSNFDNKITDNTKYGINEKDNFVYEIEFINDTTWISIGDKMMTWYDLEGNQIARQVDVNAAYIPYLSSTSNYGKGYIPVTVTNNIEQSVVHRKDTLVYYDKLGEEIFKTQLSGAVEYVYANGKGVVVGSGRNFEGYNKLGNLMFKYTASSDVNKVYYIPEERKGVAVTKEKVILLKAQRGE